MKADHPLLSTVKLYEFDELKKLTNSVPTNKAMFLIEEKPKHERKILLWSEFYILDVFDFLSFSIVNLFQV
jgi:hypothetical protein